MTRINFILWIAVVLSALYLVHIQYQSRHLFTELDRAQAQAHKLNTDNERLQVERRAQATPERIERIAKQQLHMRTASPAITLYVTDRPDLTLGGAAQ